MARMPPGTRVALVVLAVMAAFVAIGSGLAYRSERDERGDRLDQTARLAVNAGLNADRFLSDRLEVLTAIAAAPPVRTSDLPGMLAYFQAIDSDRLGFGNGLGWVDAQGISRVSTSLTPEQLPVDLHDRAYVQAVIATHAPFVSDAVIGKLTGNPLLPMAVPTFDQSGAFSGMVIGAIRLDLLAAATKEQRFGTDDLMILDRSGNIIAQPRPLDGLVNVAGDPLLAMSADAPSGLLTGATNFAGQHDRVIAYAKAPTGEWTVLIDRSESDLLASARRTLVEELAALAAFALLAAGFAVWFGRRINRDVARETRAVEELSLREARLSALTTASTQAMWTVDRFGEVREPAKRWSVLTGMPMEQIERDGWASSLRPADAEAAEAAWRAGIATGEPFELEQRVRRPAGEEQTFIVRAVPLRDAAGAIREWVGVDIDVTERKNREAFEQAFVANIAHDVKNPLAAVKAQTQLLRRRIRTGRADLAMVETTLGILDGGLERMNRRIEELADVARLRAGNRLELHLAPADLGRLARGIAESYQQTTDRHEIVVEGDDAPLVGTVDPGRIERVIDNLVSNAIKYSPDGGRVTIRVRATEPGWAELSVVDTGIGIPAEDLPLVFERYRRAGNTTVISGSGIGLAGARQIVEQHGGRIEIVSEEGSGSRFVVLLPLEASGEHREVGAMTQPSS